MEIPSNNHLQAPDDEGQFAADQGAFYSNYCQDGRSPEWQELVMSVDANSSMQEGFTLSSPSANLKAKRRKSVEVPGSRIVRAAAAAGRRGRHSKVCTARGTRDRRVRLSPKTAIQFYDVQDRLGYDRPSKAIDWLMKEAKAAIDALQDEPQAEPTIAAGNHSSPKTQRDSECGIIESCLNQLNDNITNPDQSSFGFFTRDGAAPLLSSNELNEDPITLHQYELLSSIPPEFFDPNLEMIRLQRIFHFPGLPVSGRSQMFCEREPLQSRINNNSPLMNPPFSGFRLPHGEIDIPKFAAAGTLAEDTDNIPASCKPSSFLHYQV